ncbi:hypothetical protein EVAR_56748_1 [Eumeta japonica]|uniref:Ig-like domain-containing protein n=1 Tax=Eumeta variegata TaxID=151549 RepID=A0A4C2ADQ5_EUMVA|nr:hypothetical protein EVAR_56748_1 [Eumeta japonica]
MYSEIAAEVCCATILLFQYEGLLPLSRPRRSNTQSLLLKILRVSVPLYRIRGQTAQLDCVYELGGDTLYSVKWYRDNEEFYRYLPQYDPQKTAYKLEGVKVDNITTHYPGSPVTYGAPPPSPGRQSI